MKRSLCTLLVLALLLLSAASAERTEPDHFGDVVRIANCKQYVTLRDQPETDAEAIAQVPLGDEALLLFPHAKFNDKGKEFSYILWQGKPGYVLSDYLELAAPADLTAPLALRWPTNEDWDVFESDDRVRTDYAEAVEDCVAATKLDPGNADYLIGREMTVTTDDAWIPVYGEPTSVVPATAIAAGETVTYLGHETNGRVRIVMEYMHLDGYLIGLACGWVDADCLTLRRERRGTPVTDVTDDELRAIYSFMNIFPYMCWSDTECDSIYPLFDAETNNASCIYDFDFGKILMQEFYYAVCGSFGVPGDSIPGDTEDEETSYSMPMAVPVQIALQYFDCSDNEYACINSEHITFNTTLTLSHGASPVDDGALRTRIDSIEDMGDNSYALRFHIEGTDDFKDDRRGLIVISTNGGFGDPDSFRLKYFIFDHKNFADA